MDTKIIVATHREYPMPTDSLYLPLQVGAAVNGNLTPYQKDNTGDNISAKNPGFCELTGLYWAWKNLDASHIGLVHYRRRLVTQKRQIGTPPRNLSEATLQPLLARHHILLPKKRHYLIENLYDHYRHTTFVQPLDLTGKIIRTRHPAYYPEFQNLHHRTSAHMFNIMIMRKDLLNDYCTWLFDILFELERQLNPTSILTNLTNAPITPQPTIANRSNLASPATQPATSSITSRPTTPQPANSTTPYNQFHARFYGRISELLLDVYLNTRHLPYGELPLQNTEPTNWPKKIHHFLNAKYRGVKYETSL